MAAVFKIRPFRILINNLIPYISFIGMLYVADFFSIVIIQSQLDSLPRYLFNKSDDFKFWCFIFVGFL